jgi:hypothetical protein
VQVAAEIRLLAHVRRVLDLTQPAVRRAARATQPTDLGVTASRAAVRHAGTKVRAIGLLVATRIPPTVPDGTAVLTIARRPATPVHRVQAAATSPVDTGTTGAEVAPRSATHAQRASKMAIVPVGTTLLAPVPLDAIGYHHAGSSRREPLRRSGPPK